MSSTIIDKVNKSNTTPKTLNKKNYCAIDIAKFIAAILVMLVHMSGLFENKWVHLFVANILCRYAVPFYFISSGFFLFKKVTFENGKMEKSKENFRIFLKYEVRIVILYAIWSLIYGALRFYEYTVTNAEYSFFKDYIISVIFSYSYYHTWYLLSIIMAVPFIYLMLRFVKVKYTFILSAILYILGAVVYSYYWLPYVDMFVNVHNYIQTFGDAIFRAMPLIMMSLLFVNYKSLSKKNSAILLILFIVLNIAEVLLLNIFTENSGRYSYVITTLPLAICVFSVISNINITVNKQLCSYLRKASTIIYCVHPLVYYFITKITFPSLWINFALSLVICLVFSFLLIWLSDLKHGKVLKYLY